MQQRPLAAAAAVASAAGEAAKRKHAATPCCCRLECALHSMSCLRACWCTLQRWIARSQTDHQAAPTPYRSLTQANTRYRSVHDDTQNHRRWVRTVKAHRRSTAKPAMPWSVTLTAECWHCLPSLGTTGGYPSRAIPKAFFMCQQICSVLGVTATALVTPTTHLFTTSESAHICLLHSRLICNLKCFQRYARPLPATAFWYHRGLTAHDALGQDSSFRQQRTCNGPRTPTAVALAVPVVRTTPQALVGQALRPACLQRFLRPQRPEELPVCFTRTPARQPALPKRTGCRRPPRPVAHSSSLGISSAGLTTTWKTMWKALVLWKQTHQRCRQLCVSWWSKY